MAGNYMNAPAHRLAYDRDGSVGVSITNANTLVALTAANLQTINAESEDGLTPPSSGWRLAIVFPISVNLAAFFLALSTTAAVSIQTSKDTTTGIDGTWTEQVSAASYSRSVKPNYRRSSEVTSIPGGASSQNVLGIRIWSSAALPLIRAFHIYGSPGTAASPHRIALWHPTLDEPLAPAALDWGDVPRSTSADRQFRVKNLSPSLTANSIDLYVEALTPGTPSVAGMHTLSDNGGSTFNSSINIPTLAPGAISPVLRVRRVVPVNAQLSVWSARVGADVGTWT